MSYRVPLSAIALTFVMVGILAYTNGPNRAHAVDFTPTFTITLDQNAPSDPFALPSADDCPAGAPCKAMVQLTIPDGQAGRTSFPNSVSPDFILPASIATGSDLLIPDGAIVGRAVVSERIGYVGYCGSGWLFSGADFIYDATTNPISTTGSPADLSSFANWPQQLNGVRDAELASHPGATLYARWLVGLGGLPTNFLIFHLSDGRSASIGINGNPMTAPVTEDCGPESINLIFLGVSMDNPTSASNEGGVPLITCTGSGTQNFELLIDRNDTPPGDTTTLFDTATCSFNTATGSDAPVDLRGGTTNPGGVEVTFSEVTAQGSTSATGASSGAPPPTGFQVINLVGQTFYYDINTTASFSGPVTVCIRYDDTGLTTAQENALQLMQNAGAGFADTTTSIDTANNIICGTTSHLSLWAVMLPPPVGGMVELAVPSTTSHFGAPIGAAIVLTVAMVAALAAVFLRRRRAIS